MVYKTLERNLSVNEVYEQNVRLRRALETLKKKFFLSPSDGLEPLELYKFCVNVLSENELSERSPPEAAEEARKSYFTAHPQVEKMRVSSLEGALTGDLVVATSNASHCNERLTMRYENVRLIFNGVVTANSTVVVTRTTVGPPKNPKISYSFECTAATGADDTHCP